MPALERGYSFSVNLGSPKPHEEKMNPHALFVRSGVYKFNH